MRRRLIETLRRLVGRDGVVSVSVVVSVATALLPLLGWSAAATGAVSAALVAAGGFVAAALVSVDRALPALVGVGQAVIAAVLAFGVTLPANVVASVMAVLTVVAGLATRPQVGARLPAKDHRGNVVFTGTLDYFMGEAPILRPETEAAVERTLRRPTSERDDDTVTFRVEPNATYQLDATLYPYGAPASPRADERGLDDAEQQHQRQGRHRADGSAFFGDLGAGPGVGPALGT